jgi:predicted DNA-binding protein (MmcQ/YjbR family)
MRARWASGIDRERRDDRLVALHRLRGEGDGVAHRAHATVHIRAWTTWPASHARSVAMNVSQLKRFCRAFPHATETLYEEPYNFLVYSVGGRKFAYFKTSQPERWRFSTRVSVDRFIELTDVPGVKPARYRGRFHWITIVDVSRFPTTYLETLVECSYRRALASLSKGRRMAILGA